MVVSKRKKDNNKEIAPPTPELKRYFQPVPLAKYKNVNAKKIDFCENLLMAYYFFFLYKKFSERKFRHRESFHKVKFHLRLHISRII